MTSTFQRCHPGRQQPIRDRANQLSPVIPGLRSRARDPYTLAVQKKPQRLRIVSSAGVVVLDPRLRGDDSGERPAPFSQTMHERPTRMMQEPSPPLWGRDGEGGSYGSTGCTDHFDGAVPPSLALPHKEGTSAPSGTRSRIACTILDDALSR